MKKSIRITLLTLAGVSLASTLHAHPASTDYVDNHLKEALSMVMSQIDGVRIKPHVIGETYQGGIIFFVDDTGLHGLIAAKHDANEGQGVQWQNGETGEKVTNAKANGIGAGALNTQLIISEQTHDYQEGQFAALSAAMYSVDFDGDTPCIQSPGSSMTCYGDWSLPSLFELDLMYRNLGQNGGFTASNYWSSTEHGVSQAWLEDLQTGAQNLSDKAYPLGVVRAIRPF